MATGLEKVNFNSNPKEGDWQRMFKLPQIVLISRASKVILKILQDRLPQYVNREISDVQPGFRKGRGSKRSNCRHMLDHKENKGIPGNHLRLFH